MSRDPAEWLDAVEHAYVATATGSTVPFFDELGDEPARIEQARAAVGAIASRYLAVGTPRTFGLVADSSSFDEALVSYAAHLVRFPPLAEVRCAIAPSRQSGSVIVDLGSGPAAYLERATSKRACTISEALACDIVCVHTDIPIRASQLRRGTHVNVLCEAATIDDDLRSVATLADEQRLGELAAGIVDGRQLDEITIFIAGDLGIALGALAAR